MEPPSVAVTVAVLGLVWAVVSGDPVGVGLAVAGLWLVKK